MKKSAKRTFALVLSALMLLGMQTALAEPAEPADDLVRSTAYGDVQGVVEDNGVLAWLGVPYGTAGRWERPTAPEAWEGVKACTVSGPMAIQGGAANGAPDCLNLDIYAEAGAQNKPVLVFMHGGNNQTGSAISEFTGEEVPGLVDCVFVSLNFRIGPQGFCPLPALKGGEDAELDSGNYALLDVALALDWVKENIAGFGGDPNNITISGNSAGGRNVMAMLISPMFAGKFDKALVSSGGMTVADEEKSAIQFAHYLAPLAVRDGKAADEDAAVQYLLGDGEEVAAYLKGLSDEDLIGSFASNASIHMALFPHLYGDGVVLPKEGFAATQYNTVPVMMLAGTNEFGFFKYYGYFVSSEFKALDAETKAAATAFTDKYASDMYRIFNGQESADTMFPNYGGAPIYVCQFNYGGQASGHCSWFKYCMAPSQHASTAFLTEGGDEVLRLFDAYVANFLRSENGDPNGEGLNAWTTWDPETHLSMTFFGDETTATGMMKDKYTSYDEIIRAMEEDTTISEEIKWNLIDSVISGRWFSDAQDAHFGATSLWFADQVEE